MSWVDNGKKLFSSDAKETILWDCRDPFDSSTWVQIFNLNEFFVPVEKDLVFKELESSVMANTSSSKL